jgi:hypothetical protein
MSPLRHRMIEDMQIRNLTLNTQRVYAEPIDCWKARRRGDEGRDLGEHSHRPGEPWHVLLSHARLVDAAVPLRHWSRGHRAGPWPRRCSSSCRTVNASNRR